MPDYQLLRHRIHGPTACLPIFFREDLSVDYESMGQYAAWLVDAGVPCTCMTHGYSQQGYITAQENLAITRTYASVIGDRAVFLAATLGELWDIQATIDALYATGAHGVFLLPPPAVGSDGEAYVRFVCHVAHRTEVPLFVYGYGSSVQPVTPVLSAQVYEQLIEHDNFTGLKEDFNVATYRMELIRRYGDRLAMIGGGILRQYIQFHHYPCQSELAGFFDPHRALRIASLLNDGRYVDVLRMIEESEQASSEIYGDMYFIAVNQVIMYALGFAKTWRLRPPLVTATDAQAQKIIQSVKRHPEMFEAASSNQPR